jgi:hypothetical protein
VINRRILIMLFCLALAACSKHEVPDICRNHPQFHSEHADSNGVLSIVMTDDGRIDSEVRLPEAIFGGNSTLAVLQDVSKVYALQTETECIAGDAILGSSEGMIVGGYTSSCGAENRLRQVDVLLFESLPNLEEVVVSVVTSATQKTFAINRQCESAIFRIE